MINSTVKFKLFVKFVCAIVYLYILCYNVHSFTDNKLIRIKGELYGTY